MRLTDKGQVTIPKNIRERVGIGPGSEVTFEVVDDHIVVRRGTVEPPRGRRIVDHLRGRGDVSLTTDQIMALTRGE